MPVNAVPTSRAPILIRLAFLLFVFTIPIESLNVSLNLGPVSLARITGLGLFGLSFLYFKRCYSVIPTQIWWFLGYLVIFIATGSFIAPTYHDLFVTQLFTFIQLVVFFWLASNLLLDERLSRNALIVYASSAVFLCLAVLLNVPGFAQTAVGTVQGDRFTAAAENPNFLGLVLAVAAVILVGLALEKRLRKILLLVPMMLVLVMIVQTGSRASVVAFVAGMLCFLWPFGGTTRRKVVAVVLLAIALVGLGYLIWNNETFMSRVELTSEGDSAGRDKLVTLALNMISERPLLGWRPVEYQFEMMGRYSGVSNYPQDPHNMTLNTLVEVGLLGGIPFFMGIALCGRAAWKGRRRELGLLPIALIVTLLVGLQFHSFTTSKPMWLVFAVCAAANGVTTSQLVRREKGSRTRHSNDAYKLPRYRGQRTFLPKPTRAIH